jgi:tetratricopeptide (TPR) repeat protein
VESKRLLSTEEEEQWQELSRHIEWSERFSLIVLFVEDALLAENFKQRLQSQLQGRVSKLFVLQPTQPDTLTPDIFNALQHSLIPHAIVPCWLELHQYRSDEWFKALDNFFARFNENRDRIRRDHPRPFIILLPLAYKSRLRNIAPDLWSVRNHTDELRASQVKPTFHINHNRVVFDKVELPLMVDEQALTSPEIREWQRVKNTAIADNELFLVAKSAFDAALDLGQWSLAETLAQQLITLSHNMIANDGENALTLRDLSVALEKLGDMKKAVGNYEDAYRAYNESLQIDRELKEKLGLTPQVLRDLSISLNKVADIDTTLGRYESALTGYTESLQIRRELSPTPQVQRDLCISLNRMADIDKILGRYDAALTGYTESLQIYRKLQASLGDTRQILRDLSVSLNKVADIDAILGRYEAALTRYSESLQIRRKLKAKLGVTPQVLRDLSVSLNNVADIDITLGRYEAALTGYAESLQIRRELQAGLGDTPEVLRDISVSLEKLADCENNLQHYDKALTTYQECVPLLERLRAALRRDQYSGRINEVKTKISTLTELINKT